MCRHAHTFTWTHTNSEVSEVYLTVHAGPVKSCSATRCLTGVLRRKPAVVAAFKSNKSTVYGLCVSLCSPHLYLSFFLLSFLFGSPSACCYLFMLLCLTCFLFCLLSPFWLLSLLLSSLLLLLLLFLLLWSVLPPSAELREGWYINVCVWLFWDSWVSFF